jgi:hypothetical protein
MFKKRDNEDRIKHMELKESKTEVTEIPLKISG